MPHTLKSRFCFHGEFIGVTFIALMCVGMIIKLFLDPYDKYGKQLGPGFTVFVILFAIFLVYLTYRALNIPKITITDVGIHFKTLTKDKEINWNEVEDIQLTGKRYRSLFSNDTEITTLKLHSGEKIVIRIQCYANSPEMRLLLEKYLYEKVKPFSEKPSHLKKILKPLCQNL